MEGTYWYSDASCESMELDKAVRREVEPTTTVLRHIGIVNVNQFLLPGRNVT